jgi:dihydropyrimidinase
MISRKSQWLAGIQDRMPIMWTYGVRTGRSLRIQFVAYNSTNRRKYLAYTRAKALLEGSDADIVIWNPQSA